MNRAKQKMKRKKRKTMRENATELMKEINEEIINENDGEIQINRKGRGRRRNGKNKQ